MHDWVIWVRCENKLFVRVVKEHFFLFSSAHFIATFSMSQQHEIYISESLWSFLSRTQMSAVTAIEMLYIPSSAYDQFCFWTAMSFVDLQAIFKYPAVLQIL